jgi:hypothetical protein
VNTFDRNAWSGWSAVPGDGTTQLSDTATVFQNKLYLYIGKWQATLPFMEFGVRPSHEGESAGWR